VNGWQWTGLAFELVGLVCAAVGFRQTWYEYARGERFLEPMLRPVTSRARTVQNWLRKLLRRPGKPRVVQASAVSAVGVVTSVTARVGWGPPPDPATDLAGYAAVVTQRINALHEKVQQQRHDLAAETEARKTAIGDAQAALTAEIDQVRALSRQVAVGGLRLQEPPPRRSWARFAACCSLVVLRHWRRLSYSPRSVQPRS
jgi:hypothetical protein